MKSRETLSPSYQAGLWGSASESAAISTEATDLIADVCSSFISMLDWRSAAWPEGNVYRFVLMENSDTEDGTCHIELRASPADDQLQVTGGFHDNYQRHIVVSDQCLPLSWANRQRLAELLTEMLVNLKRSRGTYSGSESALNWFG